MGNVVGHESQVRIRVRKTGDLREFKIEKALDLPPKTCLLTITDQGLFDTDKKPKTKAKPGTEDSDDTKAKDKKTSKKTEKSSKKTAPSKAAEPEEAEEEAEEPEEPEETEEAEE